MNWSYYNTTLQNIQTYLTYSLYLTLTLVFFFAIRLKLVLKHVMNTYKHWRLVTKSSESFTYHDGNGGENVTTKKWLRVLWNFIAIIPTGLLCL